MIKSRLYLIPLVIILMSNGCSSIEKRLSSEMRYTIGNEELFPGEILRFTAQLPKGVKKGQVRFLNRTFVMYPRFDLEERTYSAYMPIPSKVKPGQYVLQVKFPVIKSEVPIRAKFTIRVLPNFTERNENKVRLKKFNIKQYEQDQKKIRKLLAVSTFKPDKLRDFVLPLGGRMVSTFGTTRVYNKVHRIPLKGLEIIPLGTGSMDVSAAAAGKIVLAQKLPMLGRCVLIDHGRSFMTLYCHLRSIVVKEGKQVDRGAKIGRVGRSGGAAVNRRLYYQVFVAGVPINIERYVGLNIFE